MGFKVDTSFLRFLTMGALGVRQVVNELSGMGFEPIELERYCTSNKIWQTKVKRLRLPDLLCIKTGLRIEVRAKSDLKIKMSDTPNNPDRVWDAGCRDQDIVGLIACTNGPDGPEPAANAVYFSIRGLRDSIGMTKLGPPKSASEGAERDRTWPAIIPSRPGKVLSVNDDRLIVQFEGDGKTPRRQTYNLNGKHSYVVPDDTFPAGITILAGAPECKADLDQHKDDIYSPLEEIKSDNAVDRFAAVKALRFRDDLHKNALPALENLLDQEKEIRVLLEAAASAAYLDSDKGQKQISIILHDGESKEMSMEAVLILAELKTDFAREQLVRTAKDESFRDDERRQAAVWGLGKSGIKAYEELLPFIADDDEDVAFHAITAFGTDTTKATIERLIEILLSGDEKKAPAASEALKNIDNKIVIDCLTRVVNNTSGHKDWVLATIGRLSPNLVRERLTDPVLIDRLKPMLLIAQDSNWLANEEAATDIAFLSKQFL